MYLVQRILTAVLKGRKVCCNLNLPHINPLPSYEQTFFSSCLRNRVKSFSHYHESLRLGSVVGLKLPEH